MSIRFLIVFFAATMAVQAQVLPLHLAQSADADSDSEYSSWVDHSPAAPEAEEGICSEYDGVPTTGSVRGDAPLPVTPGLTITPHPARMTASIRVSGVDTQASWTLQVCDLFGRTMHRRHLQSLENGGDVLVDVQQYATGVYTVILSSGRQTLWKNMVVRSN